MGIWDGKYYKLYDSGLNNGSVRDKYDSVNPQFDLGSVYSRFFGTYESSFSELLDEIPINQWHVEFGETNSKVSLSCKISGNTIAKWNINLDKNCLIEKFEKSSTNLNTGKILATLESVVTESEEISPGIWLPTRAHEIVNINGREYQNRLEVENISINKPEIEKVFDFEFPIGSRYYDYRIEKVVIVKR